MDLRSHGEIIIDGLVARVERLEFINEKLCKLVQISFEHWELRPE